MHTSQRDIVEKLLKRDLRVTRDKEYLTIHPNRKTNGNSAFAKQQFCNLQWLQHVKMRQGLQRQTQNSFLNLLV